MKKSISFFSLILFFGAIVSGCTVTPTPNHPPSSPISTSTSIPISPAPTQAPLPALTSTPPPSPTPIALAGSLTNPGPQGGLISQLVIDPVTPSTLYAVIGGCIFKSADGGRSWRAIITTRNHLALAIDPLTPTTIYAGAGNWNLFKSMDGGENWRMITTDFGFNSLAIDPSTPTTLYAIPYAWTKDGLFRSTDGGENWIQLHLLFRSWVTDMAISPSDPDILYAGMETEEGNGLFKTTDGGKSWIKTGLSDLIVNTVIIDPTKPDIIYAGTDREGIYKSTDGGSHWLTINIGLPKNLEIRNLRIDTESPHTIYTSCPRDLFKSTDGGEHWQAMDIGFKDNFISALTVSASGSLFTAIYPIGIFKSTDEGESWQALDSGPVGTVITRAAIDPLIPTTIYAIAEFGEIYKSTDGGMTWRSLNTSAAMKMVNTLVVDPLKTTILYAGTQEGLFKSPDGGESWHALIKRTGINQVVIDPLTPVKIYATTYGGRIYRSIDSGETWRSLTAPLQLGPSSTIITQLLIDPTNTKTLYTNTIYGIYKSTNSGTSWQAINFGKYITIHGDTSWETINVDSTFKSIFRVIDIRFIVMDPKMPTTIYTGLEGFRLLNEVTGEYDFLIIKSTDGGETWSAINNGLPIVSERSNMNGEGLMTDPTTSSTLYAWTNDSFFKSVDGGTNWAAVSTGLPNISFSLLAIDPSNPSTFYFGTAGRGVFALHFTN